MSSTVKYKGEVYVMKHVVSKLKEHKRLKAEVERLKESEPYEVNGNRYTIRSVDASYLKPIIDKAERLERQAQTIKGLKTEVNELVNRISALESQQPPDPLYPSM